AVMITTGMSCQSGSERSSSRNSNPSTLGIIRSRMITSGRAAVIASTATWPFSASVTCHPIGSSAWRTLRRTTSSSSTSRAHRLDGLGHVLDHGHQRERFEMKLHAPRLDLGEVEDVVDQGEQVP